MKRLCAPDVAAMKARHIASLRGPTLVEVYSHPSDPKRLVSPRKRGSDTTDPNPMDLHDDKRMKTSPITYVEVSKDAADLDDMEADKIAEALASMSMRSGTKAPRDTGIRSATFEVQTSAFRKMANDIANIISMPYSKAESRGHKLSRRGRAPVAV